MGLPKKEFDYERFVELKKELYPHKEIAKRLGMSARTLDKRIQELENYIDPLKGTGLRANPKIGGKLDEIVAKYHETKSTVKTGEIYGVQDELISKIVKYKGQELQYRGNRENHEKLRTHGQTENEMYGQ